MPPTKTKPYEKLKASATYPMNAGTAPAPKGKPMKTIKETPKLLRLLGKIIDIIAKHAGKKHTDDVVWRLMSIGVRNGPCKSPSTSVKRPVVARKKAMADL
jgi:hypothetical protein